MRSLVLALATVDRAGMTEALQQLVRVVDTPAGCTAIVRESGVERLGLFVGGCGSGIKADDANLAALGAGVLVRLLQFDRTFTGKRVLCAGSGQGALGLEGRAPVARTRGR